MKPSEGNKPHFHRFEKAKKSFKERIHDAKKLVPVGLAVLSVLSPFALSACASPDVTPHVAPVVVPTHEVVESNGLIKLGSDVLATKNIDTATSIVIYGNGMPEEIPKIANSENRDIAQILKDVEITDEAIIAIQSPYTSIRPGVSQVKHYSDASDIAAKELKDRNYSVVLFSTGVGVLYNSIVKNAQHITIFSPAFSDGMQDSTYGTVTDLLGFSKMQEFIARLEELHKFTGKTIDVIFGKGDPLTNPNVVAAQIGIAKSMGLLSEDAVRITWTESKHAPEEKALKDALVPKKQ